jgi:hypothetical protein
MTSPDVHIGADAEAHRDFGFSPLAFEEGVEIELKSLK